MLQRTKSARTVLASMLAVMVAVSFYPATAFADTDYEAAYNQAKSNIQAAYNEWQTAVSDANSLLPAVDEAEAAKTAAENAVKPAKQEMDKTHRILDYKTREAMDTLAQQAWSRDYGSSRSHPEWYYNTDARMAAILAGRNSANSSWVLGGASIINRLNANNTSDHQTFASAIPYGITTSASGSDDSNALTIYQKYVYFNESYDMLMLSLDYFDEHNAIRSRNTNSSVFSGPTTDLVSPYLMTQAAVNAPINVNPNHNIRSTSDTVGLRQNITGRWGEVNTPPKYTNNDPFAGMFYSEESSVGEHYENILTAHTHAGMICSWNTGGKTFEQDFANTPNATGFTVNEYRNKINNYVAKELTAYKNATNAYNQANANVTSTADAYDAAYAAWWQADRNAQKKEQAYNDAQAAEQSAYDAYMNWLNNQGSSTDEPSTPSQPTQPENPSSDAQVTGITAEATSATNLKITWNAVSNAERYSVHIIGGSDDKKLTASSNSRIVPNCTEGTTYKITVAAIIDGVEGPESEPLNYTFKYNNASSEPSQPTQPTQPSEPTEPSEPTQPSKPAKVTGVKLTENPNNGSPIVTVNWNAAANATKYKVYVTSNGKTSVGVVTKTTYNVTNCTQGTTYTVKVSGINSSNVEGEASAEASIKTASASTPSTPSTGGGTVTPQKPSTPAPAKPAPTVGTPSIKKMTVTKKKKTVDIWFNGASNAKTYRVELRRVYKLKGKKKIAVSSGWKAYNVSSPYKTTWKYKKKVSAKQAKKYQGNSNYLLKKSGKKYKLYQKKSVAPLTVKKLTRKSIYQVRITAYNGSAQKTSVVKTFTIK